MRRSIRRGHSITELLIACVSATLVLTGGCLLFLAGTRLTVKSQATNHAMRAGSSNIDRLRIQLSEACAFVLPDKTDNSNEGGGNTKDVKGWSDSRLGSHQRYLVNNVNNAKDIYATGVFLALPRSHNVTLRVSAKQTQTVALPSRLKASRGVLLYRGDREGNPAPRSGTSLWMWHYESGKLVSRLNITNRLSTGWDAVLFRRDRSNPDLLRYRILYAEKDTENQLRTQLGTLSSSSLEGSDYAVALLNYGEGTIPAEALPASGGNHP